MPFVAERTKFSRQTGSEKTSPIKQVLPLFNGLSRKNGSEQELGERPILSGFPENHEFGLGNGHALSLEEQVT